MVMNDPLVVREKKGECGRHLHFPGIQIPTNPIPAALITFTIISFAYYTVVVAKKGIEQHE